METRAKVSGKYLEYRGKPLVREGDTICYGNMDDKCILILEIMSYKDTANGKLPDKIFIQLVESENQSNILRQGMKEGLYNAFSLGLVWLEHELSKS